MAADLLERRHWIFDLDGTLTVAVHDFAALRRDLGMHPGAPILQTLRDMPASQSEPLMTRIHDWEQDLAIDARAEPDALALLEHLVATDRRLALLTRNTRETADRTLEAAGLEAFFAPELRLGRGDAEPKPSPDGILRILAAWRADPGDAVMVGDYRYDLEAGRAAGVATVWVDRHGKHDFTSLADVAVASLDVLLGP